jgi:hypothetical protein
MAGVRLTFCTARIFVKTFYLANGHTRHRTF